MSNEKPQIIARIIGMMAEYGVTLEELSQSLHANPSTPPEKKGDALSRVFAWLGGILMFAGLSAYIGMFWQEMNSAMRIIVTLGVGLVLYIWAAVSLQNGRFSRAIMPALLISIVMQTSGWFVLIDELFHHGSDWRYAVLFVTAVMGLQQAIAFQKFRITLLLFALLFFGYSFVITLLDMLDAKDNIVGIGIGISMMALSHRILRTPHASLSSLGYFFGAVAFYLGLFDLVQHTIVELLFLAVAVANLVYVSTQVRSGALLVVSTAAILGYICYFTEQHFRNTLGWPVALMLLGIAFITISGTAVKVRRKMQQ